MYFTENTGSDYAAETEVGLEIDKTDVLVLQDRDMELSSIEDLSIAIEQAGYDLVRAAKYHEKLLAVESLDAASARELLRQARMHRESMTKRYGGPRVVAAEHYLTPTMVLLEAEAEAKEQKGFFARMIDAIVNAFKWLWKKIKELFGFREKQANEKEKESKLEKLKEAEEKKLKPKSEFITSGELVSALGHLGDHVTTAMIQENAHLHMKYLEATEKLLEHVFKYYEQFKNLSKNENASANDFAVMSRGFSNNATGYFRAFGSATIKDLQDVGISAKYGQIRENEIAAAKHMTYGNALYLWASIDGENHHIEASLKKGKVRPGQSGKIDYSDYATIRGPIEKSIEDLDKALEAGAKRINSKLDEIGSDSGIRGLQASLTALLEKQADGGDQEALKRTVAFAKETTSDIGSLAMALSLTIKCIWEMSITLKKYQLTCAGREFDTPSEPAKETKEETK